MLIGILEMLLYNKDINKVLYKFFFRETRDFRVNSRKTNFYQRIFYEFTQTYELQLA